MKNSTRILFFQVFPTQAYLWLLQIRRFYKRGGEPGLVLLEDIDFFPTEKPKRKIALLALSPYAWLLALKQYPNIRFFNYCGLIYEMVRALNENGYKVDIVDFKSEHMPKKQYDLFVGHGGKCRSIVDNLTPGTPILQYVSGVHWESFNAESSERYRNFRQRWGAQIPEVFRRSFDDLTEGEEYLSDKADSLFTIYCPRMVASYRAHARKFFYTGLGAYADPKLMPGEPRNFDLGRKNFIYVGGTGGNIQKGMDVLLDAFSKTPGLNLFIYCKVEPEILKYCRAELNSPNIHYIYHWRHALHHGKLKRLMPLVNFTIHAPINAGMGTAFMASLASGMIPVGYVDYPAGPESSVLAASWRVSDLVDCILRSSETPVDWCASASLKVRAYYEENCTADGFRLKFAQLVRIHTKNDDK